MGYKSTAFLAASLLFSGVMLASCTMKSKPVGPAAHKTVLPDDTNTHLEKIQSKLENLDHRLSALERLEPRITTLDTPDHGTADHERPVTPSPRDIEFPQKNNPHPVYGEPILLYNSARSLVLEENFHEATRLFKEFLTRYPNSELADNALYWLGECHYSLGNFQEAINTFKDVVTLYPKGGKVPDALLKTAYAYLSLDDADRAHHYLKLVVRGYPFTPAGEKAEQKLKAFQ
jgi:tol-pal system protein YbgF